MGYVFPLENVVARKIPRLEAYPVASGMVKSYLQAFFKDEKIHGALIFGSINNNYSVGSDIDTLIVYEDEAGLSAIRNLRQHIESETFVPVEFIPVKRELGQKGIHTIDNAFRQHLEHHLYNGQIGKNPLDFICIKPVPYKLDLLNKLAVYIAGLEKGFVNEDFGDQRYYIFLRYILEKPVHTVREMLQSVYRELPKDENGRPIDDREGLCREYEKQFFGHSLLLEDLMKILEAQKNYREFLRHLPTENLEKAYIQELRKIEAVYPNASRFIRKNALLL